MPYFGVPIRNGLPIGLGTLTALAQAVAVVVPPVSSDPYFEYVSLLANTTSTNGAQNNTFLDGSTNAFSITRNGNTTQGTFSPFSQTGWSNYFDGNGDSLQLADNAAFEFGSGDFTLEAWIHPTAYATLNSGQYNSDIISKDQTSLREFGFYISGTASSYTAINFVGFSNNTTFTIITGTQAFNLGVWYHVAAVRSGNNVYLYVNGVQVNSTTAFSQTIQDTASVVYIGARNFDASNQYFFPGYISNLRIVKGTAVYTSAFTPPTSPLTAISGTSLLTCQSNRFIDNSSNAFAITRNGDVSVQAFSPFNPTAAWSASTNGGSGYFDGTGDYLTTPTTTALSFGTGDFTVECWVYKTTAANSSIIDGRVNPGVAAPWAFYIDASNFPYFYEGTVYTSSVAVSLNTWTHVAATRSSGTLKIFVNGVQGYSATVTTNLDRTAGAFIGAAANTVTPQAFYQGFMCDLRVVKGTAVYTAAFTPPTAPLTAIANTSLLLNFTNAGIYDSASGNDLETVGNAQVSTVQAKWGTTSMAFDGTGDWLIAPDRPPLRLGTANFTIEGWVYLGGVSPPYSLLGKGTSTTGWNIGISSLAYLTFTHGSTTITSSSTITPFAWTHFAIVRGASNLLSIYQNGVQVASAIVATDFSQTNPLYVGASRTTTEAFVGYIDDLRITNGYARYTANFTPPTAAFPVQ